MKIKNQIIYLINLKKIIEIIKNNNNDTKNTKLLIMRKNL
jgi:hypothetical protein